MILTKIFESPKSWLPYLSLMVIFFASLGDEIAAITFSFDKVDNESMMRLSLLMTCPLIGGICSAPLAISLLNRLNPRRLLTFIFLCSGAVCVLAVIFPFPFSDYLACFTLGGLGAMFWSTLNILIVNLFSDKELVGINQLTQAFRNTGYILAPMLAGLAAGKINGTFTLLFVAAIYLISALVAPTLFQGRADVQARPSKSDSKFHAPKVFEFFKISRMATTTLPLMVTILTTSVFNVAFIHYILVDRAMTKVNYGFIVSGISIGLVAGPLLFRILFAKEDLNHSLVACLSASIIGLSVALSGYFVQIGSLFVTLLFLGVANGIQNLSMATFTMKVIPKERRIFLMPTYSFIIQLSVLSGFLIAGFIPTQSSASVLICGGALAVGAGIVGVGLNARTMKTSKLDETGGPKHA